MGKPSIFNKDYHKIMRRRKIVFRTIIILSALAVIFITYDKSAIPNLKKFAANLKLPFKAGMINKEAKQPQVPPAEEIPDNNEEITNNEEVKPESEQGEYSVKLSSTETLEIIFEKKGDDKRFTGIRPDNLGVSFDIREDGKAMVFDNPRTSEIWLCNIDGSLLRLNPDTYVQQRSTGGGYNKYNKADIMERYQNKYVWAAKPKFLKDGRVVYQSNLPWFMEINKYYLWAVNIDGTDNRKVLNTDSTEPIEYYGFTEDGRLIIVLYGNRYVFNIDGRNIQKID